MDMQHFITYKGRNGKQTAVYISHSRRHYHIENNPDNPEDFIAISKKAFSAVVQEINLNGYRQLK